jgi:hypothetical protein
MKLRAAPLLVTAAALLGVTGGQQAAGADNVSVRVDSPMPPPRWVQLQRQLLDENLGACREFFRKYFDERGYLRCVVRWGANDGPDDAPENFNRWPELHALGADDEVLALYLKGWEGHLRQYTEAKTTHVPVARRGMYHKEFIAQFDWMHNGEGLQPSTAWPCRCPPTPATATATAASPASTWARTRAPPTTTPGTRSSGA